MPGTARALLVPPALLPLLLLMSGGGLCQLAWVSEPPARLAYSNSSGIRVSCVARGAPPPAPPPAVDWLGDDGAPLAPVPGLREVFSNGTLWLRPFSVAQYRSDVHAAGARCRAATAAGALLSRDLRPTPVMDVWWEVRLDAAHALAGGAALLTCAVSAPARPYLRVTRWLQDDRPLPEANTDGQWVWGGWQLVVATARAGTRYACEATHQLTGHTKRSGAVELSLSSPSDSISPRMLTASSEETVQAGDDIRLVCAAVANPPPEYSWFRWVGGRAVRLGSDLRVSTHTHALVLRQAQLRDAGRWWCRAHNALGEARLDITLHVRSRLAVAVRPALQVAHSGSSVSFECVVSGEGADGNSGMGGGSAGGGATGVVRLRWLHDGAPVGGASRVLRVHSVARAHRGFYQCFAEKDLDVAQAAAELRLGDTAPELHYTFIEQALHPGPAVALQCAASGTPAPRITWLLDNQPLEDITSPHRSTSHFINARGEVVSFLNVTSVRTEDGGRYTCRAATSRGAVEHSARLNVYGPPAVRALGPQRVVAGANATLHCPFSGFPISEIRWERAGAAEGAVRAVGAELRLWPAEVNDAGVYTCRVTAPDRTVANNDLQLFVRNPPKISGFSFPTELVEGSSVQVLCGIMSGDKPVYFSWLKDGQNIPRSLQVQQKSLEEFSFLIFSSVSARHSGDYTCVASNVAAEVNHTARLAVKVSPSWVHKPENVSVLLGSQILTHCLTKGYPEPRVTWLKEHGEGSKDFRPISSSEYQMSVLSNGSLSANNAVRELAGRYLCRADNGIGRGLEKMVTIAVHEPAFVEATLRNVSAAHGAAAELTCSARGDPPLSLRWTRDAAPLHTDSYRVSITEKRTSVGLSSRLSISRSERGDSGVYRCRAENAHGRDEALLYLTVQELPTAPTQVSCVAAGTRSAELRWQRGDDGNAHVSHYRLQLRALGAGAGSAPPELAAGDWTHTPRVHVPASAVHTSLSEEGAWLHYSLSGLRPATAYALRIAAVNALGHSQYSDALVLRTQEEAPSEPPLNVNAQAIEPDELVVQWQPPPQESWNGELLGYAVTWRLTTGADAAAVLTDASVAGVVTARGWGAQRAVVAGLQASAIYELSVRAYNVAGGGPTSASITLCTLEGEPEWSPTHVRCEALSAAALRVRWLPATGARTDRLLSYDVMYESWSGDRRTYGWVSASGQSAELGGLRRAHNYTVYVRARSHAGAGPASPPVYCATLADAPGPPTDVKAAANSADSLLVSWRPPDDAGDHLTHYTVYTRPQWSGQQSSLLVPHSGRQTEFLSLVRVPGNTGDAGVPVDVWVTTSDARGEGAMSAVVTATINARAPAKIMSFGRQVLGVTGQLVRISCVCVGSPSPHAEWRRADAALPADGPVAVEGNDLIIYKMDRSLEDNYTCVARNAWGVDRTTWRVVLRRAPPAPAARLLLAMPTALQLAWQPQHAADVHGYLVEHRLADSGAAWSLWRAPESARSHTLRRLACGARYEVRVRAYNAQGDSAPATLHLSTLGGPSVAAPQQQLVQANATCARLNLLTWDTAGCPLAAFHLQIRTSPLQDFRSEWVSASEGSATLCSLATGAWHQLRVTAHQAAHRTAHDYYFATLTANGEVVTSESGAPWEGSFQFSGSVLGAWVGASLLLLAALFIGLGWPRLWCDPESTSTESPGRRGSLPTPPSTPPIKEPCEPRVDGQLYTSSPIKPVPAKGQELYEISPYATFSMSGGSVTLTPNVGSLTPGGGTLRTFGRAEPPPLSAAPPPSSDVDDYTLSRAVTLSVRGGACGGCRGRDAGDSDSESSASPCADCIATYRLTGRPSEAGSCGPTDSRPESTVEASVRARRRPRRHHAPQAHRYQRQGHERRDYTIHV